VLELHDSSKSRRWSCVPPDRLLVVDVLPRLFGGMVSVELEGVLCCFNFEPLQDVYPRGPTKHMQNAEMS
jgi:hypothetical protein